MPRRELSDDEAAFVDRLRHSQAVSAARNNGINAAKQLAEIFLNSKHVNSDIVRELVKLLDAELTSLEFPKLP